MAANLRIKFESGMIVILLAAPWLAKPLTHKLVRQLLRHCLPHAYDPIAQHFADGLVLAKPTHLIYSTQVPEKSFGSFEQGLIFWTHHNIGNITVAPIWVQQQPLPKGQGEWRDGEEVLVVAY